MNELLTAAQMRAIETAAIESGDVTGLELMERAGRGVVEAIFDEWPELAATSHHAVVLCGPGNNGGDGFVVARLLKDWGWEVEVFLYGDAEKLPLDAKVNYERWVEMGEVGDFGADWHITFDTIVFDAVFGTGLSRMLPVEVEEKLLEIHRFEPFAVVAVDLPSGADSDSGIGLPNFPVTQLCVTFHSMKLAHAGHHFARRCERVLVKSIGLEDGLRARVGVKRRPVRSVRGHRGKTLGQVVKLVGVPAVTLLGKANSGHKYSHGHALILSGPPGAGGAARLAARGALRIGAGLVSVVCEDDTVPEHAAQLTAIMIKRANGAGELAALLEDPRFNAVCLGPGLGVERAQELVAVALGEARGPGSGPGRAAGGVPAKEPGPRRGIVLDADALTAFADDPDALFAMLHKTCVLTPHAGEFKRLFPDIAEKLEAAPTQGPAYSKVDATREAAKRAGCVVLFKGPDTVIASPDGRASINSGHYDRAAPWLATAGSGDVLAGFITGLLARGFEPMQAAETAAWLHVECARSFGPGLIAEDLPEELPKVFRELGVISST